MVFPERMAQSDFPCIGTFFNVGDGRRDIPVRKIAEVRFCAEGDCACLFFPCGCVPEFQNAVSFFRGGGKFRVRSFQRTGLKSVHPFSVSVIHGDAEIKARDVSIASCPAESACELIFPVGMNRERFCAENIKFLRCVRDGQTARSGTQIGGFSVASGPVVRGIRGGDAGKAERSRDDDSSFHNFGKLLFI